MNANRFTLEWETPLGIARATSNGRSLIQLEVEDGDITQSDTDCLILAQTKSELSAYFRGELQSFTVPIDPQGTEFQQKVWEQVRSIPFGETLSYGDIANRLQMKNGQRAVGSANGDNPIWIIIPCHRVIGADGGLCGYAGGLWRKQALIGLESGQMSLL
ncbi:methylated-DNA--[protein]-cysteine S-methyltransferase [Kamptonema cortianum]|nr:methylated-DNA--[protein]-cysteine S-methyltransferase [Kamptonema cortianum]